MFSRKINHAYYGFFPNSWEQSPYPIMDGRINQPNPYPAPPSNWNPNWYPPQHLSQGLPNAYPYGQGTPGGPIAMANGQSSSMGHPYAQTIFQNPLQPNDQPQPYYYQNQGTANTGFYPNPYPNHAFIPKQPSGIQSVMNSFKAQDGTVDINKMINTAGQMMSAVSQVSSMVKGLGGMLKV